MMSDDAATFSILRSAVFTRVPADRALRRSSRLCQSATSLSFHDDPRKLVEKAQSAECGMEERHIIPILPKSKLDLRCVPEHSALLLGCNL